MKLIDVRPPRSAFALLAASLVVHLILPPSVKLHFPIPLVGLPLALLGLAVMTWGWKLFRDVQTPICPTSESTALITEGAYRVSRNPMYLGIVVALTGIGLSTGSIPFLVPPVIFFLIMNRTFIPYEETKMERISGERYCRYKSRVGRWL